MDRQRHCSQEALFVMSSRSTSGQTPFHSAHGAVTPNWAMRARNRLLCVSHGKMARQCSTRRAHSSNPCADRLSTKIVKWPVPLASRYGSNRWIVTTEEDWAALVATTHPEFRQARVWSKAMRRPPNYGSPSYSRNGSTNADHVLIACSPTPALPVEAQVLFIVLCWWPEIFRNWQHSLGC